MSELPPFKGQRYKHPDGKSRVYSDEFGEFIKDMIPNNLSKDANTIARFYGVSHQYILTKFHELLRGPSKANNDPSFRLNGDYYSYLEPKKETTYNELDSLSSPFYNPKELTGEELQIFKNL